MRGSRTAPLLLSAPVTVTSHVGGLHHVRSTVKKMAELARTGSHSFEIRNLATRITAHVPSKSPAAELRALYNWVRDNIRYRYDPVELEWLQSPARTVAEGAGDCDDQATLLAALAGSLGHRWRFRTVGERPDMQKHVQAQAFDGTQWVDLDPVLEPTQKTTAPRRDAGTFGLAARGAAHLWDSEGNMLSGPRRRHVRSHLRGLSGPTTARDRALWSIVPYFMPAPPFPPYGGTQPPMPGAFPDINKRYRSSDAPGFEGGKSLQHRHLPASTLSGPTTAADRELWDWIPYDPTGSMGAVPGVTLALPLGCVDERKADAFGLVPFTHPMLGAGFLRKLGRKVAGLKVVRKASKLKVVRKVAGLKAVKGTIRVGGKILDGTRIIVKSPYFQAAAIAAAQAIPGAGPAAIAAKAAMMAAKAAKAIKAGKQGVRAIKGGVQLAQKLTAKGGRKKLAAIAQRAGATALTAALPAGGRADWKKPHQPVARKYPKNARQIFDRHAGVFRVFVPAKGLTAARIKTLRARGGKARRTSHGVAGLGAFKPTISFSLLGAVPGGAQSARSPELVAAARRVVTAVNTFAKNHAGKPPMIRLPAITAFQIAEKNLTIDGLWGTNTHAAVSWYLQGSGVAIPAYAQTPKFRVPLTWSPPLPAQPAPAVRPKPEAVVPASPSSPKPVVVKPAAPPAASFPAPSGYVEIGSEAVNPGLAPAGYVGPSAPPAPTVPGTPVQPGAPTGGAPKPADPRAVAEAIAAGHDDGQGPTADATPSLVPVDSMPAAMDPYSPPPGTLAPVIDVDSPRLVDVSTGPVPSSPANYIPAGELPVVPGPVAPLPLPAGPAYQPQAKADSGNAILWASLAYLWFRNRKAAA